MSNHELYAHLRQTYPSFVYETYQYNVQPDGLHIAFSFRIGDHHFTPHSVIPSRPFVHFDQPAQILDTLVFNIGMIELISYWKCACPPSVVIQCGCLDNSQRSFWKKLYWHGLGEFFYVNGIHASYDDFVSIIVNEENITSPAAQTFTSDQRPANHYLVPIGGGKDSVVTLELLSSQQGFRTTPLIMNPRGATIGCIQAAGYTMDDVFVIHRTIDPHLLELNALKTPDGTSLFLNGHTPFSAMLAFYTLLAAQLSGIPNVALSNENSANESTVVGTTVNHQYSKSLEFENDFRNYYATLTIPQFNYFSFLRPLSELQIAMLFSRFEKYHPVFRSCNVGSKQDIWCGHCAKCLFAYIILSPFIPPEKLNSIFGHNLLDDTSLQTEFDQLTGNAPTKPFECVGTVGEVIAALSMTLNRWYPIPQERPALLKQLPTYNSHTLSLRTLFPDHNLSTQELAIVNSHVQRATA